MAPRQLSNKLLDNCVVRVHLGKCPHGEQVGTRKTAHLRKFRPQVFGEPFDNLCSPTLVALTAQNFSADVPIEQYQLAIDREDRSHLRRADARL